MDVPYQNNGRMVCKNSQSNLHLCAAGEGTNGSTSNAQGALRNRRPLSVASAARATTDAFLPACRLGPSRLNAVTRWQAVIGTASLGEPDQRDGKAPGREIFRPPIGVSPALA